MIVLGIFCEWIFSNVGYFGHLSLGVIEKTRIVNYFFLVWLGKFIDTDMAGQALRRLMAEYKRKDINIRIIHSKIKENSFHCARIRFIIYDLKYFFTTNLHSILELTINPPEGILAGPISEENFFEWEALITGNVMYSEIQLLFHIVLRNASSRLC